MSCRYELKCEARLLTEEGRIEGACVIDTITDMLKRQGVTYQNWDDVVQEEIKSNMNEHCVQSNVDSEVGQFCSLSYRI